MIGSISQHKINAKLGEGGNHHANDANDTATSTADAFGCTRTVAGNVGLRNG